MRQLPDRVLQTIRRRSLIPAGGRVVAAVSGGPDSVAMLRLLRDLEPKGEFALAGVAHFNHRLRGEDSDADEEFCRALASSLGLEFRSESADVAVRAAALKRSIEDTARLLRYEFFERVRVDLDADVVAVGHTRDDQAETYLLRLFRGAGPRGLSGIRARAGTVVRPLIDISRRDLHAWVEERRLDFRRDASNDDVGIPRNRIRHQLIPMLERFQPGASDLLARAAAVSAEDEDFLTAAAIQAARNVVLSDREGEVRLDIKALSDQHPAIARRIVRQVMHEVAPGRFIGLEQVDAALAAAVVGRVSGPGQEVWAEGEALVFSAAEGRKRSVGMPSANVFRYPLSIPGEARIPESGVSISAELVNTAALRADTILDGVALKPPSDGLAVRNRRPGDVFRPLGMRGRKKLQDYLVDRKVPRQERDRVPLVVDGHDRIVWVVGHVIAEEFRVTTPEGPVLLLKVRHLGETV